MFGYTVISKSINLEKVKSAINDISTSGNIKSNDTKLYLFLREGYGNDSYQIFYLDENEMKLKIESNEKDNKNDIFFDNFYYRNTIMDNANEILLNLIQIINKKG